MRNLITIGIALVLAGFFYVPIAFIAYAALGGIVGAFVILAPLIALQWLAMKLLWRSDRRS